VNDVNSLHFLLNSNNNTDNKCDNTENCVALQITTTGRISELKSAQLIIKLLQEECNQKEEIKPNDVDNLTNSDQNTSEIISNEWCSASCKSYNKLKKSTGCLNKPTMKTSNKSASAF